MVSTYIIVSAVIAFIAIALGAAYTTGALDPVIEQMGIMVFKAKAEAEKKKLQAQGMKEGEDFVGGKFPVQLLLYFHPVSYFRGGHPSMFLGYGGTLANSLEMWFSASRRHADRTSQTNSRETNRPMTWPRVLGALVD